jgi:hypothetical protein
MRKSRTLLKNAAARMQAVMFSSAALTAAIAILPAVAREQITSFSDTQGEHVFYANESGHVIQLAWNTNGPISNPGSWSAQDLTSVSGATGLAMVPARFSSFNDTYGEHVFYLGTNGHIYQLYLPWRASWVNQDLTSISNATITANPSFGVGASMSDLSGEHVFYVGTNDHIYQFYRPWNGSWENQDLTASAAGAVPDDDGTLAAFADGAGEHVVYFDDNRLQVHQLYWNWTGTQWIDQNLTSATGGPSIISSGLTAFYDAWGEHVIYPALDAGAVHIDQLYYPYGTNGSLWVGQEWVNQDLTAWPGGGGHTATGTTPLTSFADVMAESVYYLDTNGHVNQLFAHTGWTNQDLTTTAGATVTAYTTCLGWLTSISDETGDHVFYVGNTDLNVHMLYRNGSSTAWADVNVTASDPASEKPFANACLIQ